MFQWLNRPSSYDAYDDDEIVALHRTLRRHVGIARRVVPLAIILIIAGFCWSIRNSVVDMDNDAVAAQFEKRAAVIGPRLNQMVLDVGERVAPVVSEALQDQSQKTLKTLGERLDQEIESMTDTILDKMVDELMRQLRTANEGQRKRLLDAFPELAKDPQRADELIASFQKGYTAWASRLLTATFDRHMLEFTRIRGTLGQIVATESVAPLPIGATGTVDGETAVSAHHVLGLWLEILDETISGGVDETNLLAEPESTAPSGKGGK